MDPATATTALRVGGASLKIAQAAAADAEKDMVESTKSAPLEASAATNGGKRGGGRGANSTIRGRGDGGLAARGARRIRRSSDDLSKKADGAADAAEQARTRTRRRLNSPRP